MKAIFLPSNDLIAQSRQKGSGLVEVLVSVVLLSLGLLGMTGMQLASMRNSHSASHRYQATNMAYDILDRMRSNHVQALTGDYTVAVGAASGGSGMANTDVSAWKQSLRTLPSGDGSIAINGNIVTVTVQWNEGWDKDLSGTNKNAQVTFKTQI